MNDQEERQAIFDKLANIIEHAFTLQPYEIEWMRKRDTYNKKLSTKIRRFFFMSTEYQRTL